MAAIRISGPMHPRLPLAAFAAASLALSLPASAAPVPAKPIPLCSMDQLSLATDQENGSFDGMSHGGTLVVLRNLGTAACRVPAIPEISFADDTHPLDAKGTMAGARFMHPGPVVLPVAVAAGAELTASLRWVAGEVYTDNLCITPTKLTVTVGGKTQTVAFSAQLCGERAKGVTYEMTRFAPDPPSPK